jgi:hypothetical protein
MSTLVIRRAPSPSRRLVADLRRGTQARLRWLRRRVAALHPFRYQVDLRDVI